MKFKENDIIIRNTGEIIKILKPLRNNSKTAEIYELLCLKGDGRIWGKGDKGEYSLEINLWELENNYIKLQKLRKIGI